MTYAPRPIDPAIPSSAPLARLHSFREKLGLDAETYAVLAPHREALLARKLDFAEHLYAYFMEIPATRAILSHETWPKVIKHNWATTFEHCFSGPPDDFLLDYIWKSGVIHVRVSIDQRWINMGFALARQFCHDLVAEAVVAPLRHPVMDVVDRIWDLCGLVSTDAYIDSTTKCDREVLQGVAHHLRNPLTVIGGYTRRLQRSAAPDSPDLEALTAIMDESKRLERLVSHVGEYMERYQQEPHREALDLRDLVAEALEEIRQRQGADSFEALPVDVAIAEEHSHIYADVKDARTAVRHLIADGLEAMEPPADGSPPRLTVTSAQDDRDANYLRTTFFTPGAAPDATELEHLLTPFHAHHPMGAGFALPIARLVANKNLGRLKLTSVAGRGLACALSLPKPPCDGGNCA